MNCPSCETRLPEDAPYRFCPFCGGKLPEQTVKETASYEANSFSEAPTEREVPALAETLADTTPSGPPTPVAAAVVPADEAPTRLELPAVPESVSSARRQPTAASEAPTVAELPAVTGALSTAPETGQKVGDQKRFSETAWFMAAVDDELVEGEATDFSEQELMTERYVKEDTLPASVRKSYSLTLGEAPAVDDDKLKGSSKKKK